MNQPKHIAYAFQASLKNIALKDIQTMHPFPEGIRESVKFKSILASVEEIGVIEPLAVYEENGKYLLLDGHVLRSEERRVGKECRSRWSPYH